MTGPAWPRLHAALRDAHARLPALAAFCDFPDPVTPRQMAPRHDPLSDALQADTRLDTTEALAPLRDLFVAAAATAHWRDTYRDTALGATLHAHFGTYEVLGRDTPLGAENMRSFLVYQTPGFHYPMHHHPAEELYLVIAGEGEFHLEGAPSRRLRPGDTVFHPSNAPHALTTTPERPIMAYVLWRGDLLTRPVWSRPEALP